ncbi:MAG: AraC family transcriptional regulator [Bacteroidota bacterium]
MNFSPATFETVNNKKNIAVKSALNCFDSTVSCSGLSIKLPLNGPENYTVDHVNHTIKPGNFLLVNKGQEVSCKFDSKDIVESICIYLDSEIYLEIIERCTKKNQLDLVINRSDANVISEKYHVLDCELSRWLSSISAVQDLKSLTEEDFILLTEKLAMHQLGQHQMLSSLDASNYITRKELLKRLRTVKSFIFDNYSKDLKLDDLSQISYLSKYHLLRSFKDVYNITPYQALLARRIGKAKQMLVTGKAIQDVALDCGFNDRRSFSRVFKKVQGITPSAFLENNVN